MMTTSTPKTSRLGGDLVVPRRNGKGFDSIMHGEVLLHLAFQRRGIVFRNEAWAGSGTQTPRHETNVCIGWRSKWVPACYTIVLSSSTVVLDLPVLSKPAVAALFKTRHVLT